MGRQDRRRRLRKDTPSTPWDLIIGGLVLVAFIGVGVWSYFNPIITAQSYAGGSPRVHRFMINRGLRALDAKPSLEITYSDVNEQNVTTQMRAKEEGDTITLTNLATNVTTEHTADNVPDTYVPIDETFTQLRQALRNQDFVVSHQEPEPGAHQMLRVSKQVGQDIIEGFIVYFTADHAIDMLHYFRRVADGVYTQRVYSGFVTGVTPTGTTP